MKKITKKIIRLKFIQKFLATIIFLYIQFVYITSKKSFLFNKNFNKDEFVNNNAIYAFWHGRLAMMAFARSKIQVNVLISIHPDGRMISYAMEMFNFKIIEGSSFKNGLSAFKTLLDRAKNGESVAITPDGPRGPRNKIERSNIIKIAMKANLKIYPVTYSAKRLWIINSWDKFHFPLPFNHIYFMYDEPINPLENYSKENVEHYKKLLEAKMNNICYKVDKLAGHIK